MGIGFGSYLGNGTGYKTTVPPIFLSAEFGVKDGLLGGKSSIGVGAYLAYTANKWEFPYCITGLIIHILSSGQKDFSTVSSWHKLDTYVGLMLGYNVVSSKHFEEYFPVPASEESGGFTYSTFIGAKYYFTPQWAAFTELGYGIAALELGLSLKF